VTTTDKRRVMSMMLKKGAARATMPSMVPFLLLRTWNTRLTKMARFAPAKVDDEDHSGVSDNEYDPKSDEDVQEEALEIPEDFLFATPQELDVEDELEGDFKSVAPFLPLR
jgi:hypothetical protein